MSDRDLLSFRAAAWTQIQHRSSERAHSHLKGLVEALLFAAPAPLTLRDLTRLTRTKRAPVLAMLEELQLEYEDRGICIHELSKGYAFLTHPRYGQAVREVTGKKPVRMTRAQLETLAIIAYRQPVTRPELDDVRGVDCGPVLRTLLDRELIRILGKKEEPGRPLLYGTTDTFLELFRLKSLAELPTLREFTELSDDSRDTYERRLGESAPAGALAFDDEPDEPIDPTLAQPDEEEPQAPEQPAEGEELEEADQEGEEGEELEEEGEEDEEEDEEEELEEEDEELEEEDEEEELEEEDDEDEESNA